MNMQAVLIRGILLVAMSMAMCLAIVQRAYSHRQMPQAAPALVRASAPATLGQPAAVVLPTITVKPSVREIVAALESNDDFAAAAFIEAAQTQSVGHSGVLPGLHLDMPYYSFGKTLPRVSKE